VLPHVVAEDRRGTVYEHLDDTAEIGIDFGLQLAPIFSPPPFGFIHFQKFV
jgi:hypothetical protein